MNKQIQALVEQFLSKPAEMGKGAGYLAKRFKTTKENIYEAKEEARKILHGNETANLQNIIAECEDKVARLVGTKTGLEAGIHSTTKTFESTRILTQEEIKELAGVDGITCRLGLVWNKLQTNGLWTYSIQVVYIAADFYSKNELADRLKEIFPNDIEPVVLPEVDEVAENFALAIYIADDHVGLKYENGLFGNSYSAEIYEERMMKILAKVKNMAQAFAYNKVFIVRLGDEADGYNGKTTRYDHALKSESNQKQFDVYTSVNKKFYDGIFNSGIGKKYEIINCNNSNHSGLGFSHMLNKAVEFYVEAKYPAVKFTQIDKFIGEFEWGNHVIGVTHGKDEEFMKRPMPMQLNESTDLWLYDYYENKGYSPNRRWISTIKGDLHKFNINTGKSGRYVNVPSVAGGSGYIDHNYGNSKPGALLEVYDKNMPDVAVQMINL